MTSTKVKYQRSLPSLKDLTRATTGKNIILFYDEKLQNHASLRAWLPQFKYVLPLKAGENLKSIDGFAGYVKKILPWLGGYSPKENVIVSLGGGSVGDFSSFMASVIKRGVKYVHIPSTWLAAIDSAHGGKSALNVDGLKNQVGTFYPAEVIYCVKELLDNQPTENLKSGVGEALKIGLLSKGLYQKINKVKVLNADALWRLLPSLVNAKLQIVNKDPFETKGIRQLLNLGHTVGHAIEAEGIMVHGVAVQKGLEFSAEWSRRRKILTQTNFEKLKKYLAKNEAPQFMPISADRFYKRLKQDKKATSAEYVRFVFIKNPGAPKVEEVLIADIVQVARELGWVC